MASSSRDGLNMPLLHPVWRKLPMELVEVILKRVPFESCLRFRAVCKRFNSLITSPQFARECQRQQVRKPVPVIVRKCIFLDSSFIDVFNSETNSWLTIPLPILEASLYPLKLSAASGGLVCFVTRRHGRLVICNPLTRAFRLLEFPYPGGDICTLVRRKAAFTGLVVDLQAGIFTLVVVTTNKNEAKRKTFLYDSVNGSWRSGAPLPDKRSFINTLSSNGSIYGLLYDNRRAVYGLLKYNVCRDNWSQISMRNLPPVDVPFENLDILEHRCQMVLVSMNTIWPRPGDDDDDDDDYRRPWPVYRAREGFGHGETLVEDRVMSQALPRSLDSFHRWIYDANGNGDFITTGIGDVICVMKNTRPRYPLHVLHFNRSSKKSSLLPECPTTRADNWAHNNLKLKLLEPSLTVDL